MPESIQFHGDPIESNTLYVVLDDRKAFGEPYHWSLLLAGPDSASQILHATDRSGSWIYEIRQLDSVQPTPSMICLVGIGVIQPEQRPEVEDAMRSVNVPPEGGMLRTGEPFNCRTWLKMAVGALQRRGVIGLGLHVEDVETRLRIRARSLLVAREKGERLLPVVVGSIV